MADNYGKLIIQKHFFNIAPSDINYSISPHLNFSFIMKNMNY